MIFFNVKDYWMILRVACVCGYDCVCVCVCVNVVSICLWHVVKSRGTEDLSGGVIPRGLLYLYSGQGEWREVDVKAIQEVTCLFPS